MVMNGWQMKLMSLRTLPAKIGILLITIYRYMISPVMANRCRYYPSCSGYALTAVRRFGLLGGCYLAIRRLLRCHPWHEGGYDPVPNKLSKTLMTCCKDKLT